jgi:hypothetical protein
VARAAQDPGRRNAQLRRHRGCDRSSEGGSGRGLGQWRQSRLRADPVPPRYPQRRVARRLRRRNRAEEKLLAAEGHTPASPELPLVD